MNGRTVENPVTGHRVTFVSTAEQTGGELLRIEYMVPRPEEPLQYIPLHLHDVAEERFEVVAGTLGIMIDNKDNRRLLGPGEEVLIAPKTVHSFWNAGQGKLRFITDIRPAGEMQLYWQTSFGLAAAGKVNGKGVPSIWQVAVMVPLMDTYAPGVPVGLQKVLIGGLLGGVGRLLGYRAVYPEYSMDRTAEEV